MSKPATLNLSKNAIVVLEKRYLRKDENGKVIESPEQMFRRVAHNIASAELLYNPKANTKKTEQDFYSIMANLEFLPNSPTLMNAGLELQQLSACFVLPIDDSMESIFETIKNTAIIHKSGGGTGFSFSRIRPKNDRVLSTGGIASGPVSFMKVFNAATEAVKQGGTRRGANMAILNVDHPDILEFIDCKKGLTELTNFNISVAVTEKFMKTVINGGDYELVNPRTKKPVKKLNAREVFDRIVEQAWETGEPGIVFLDRINRDNPTPKLGKIESTNPCGEQPLLPYEACNLGSLNLAKMVADMKSKPSIDWQKLERTIRIAARFLENVIDVNSYPLPQIERLAKGNRKIGLGVMGFADMLIKLGIPYDSEQALKTAQGLMQFLDTKAKQASVELAQERGVFSNFKGSIYDKPKGLRLRNATVTTIAPTGTLSIIANCSSGIEPIFALCYHRNVLDEVGLVEINPLFEAIAKKENFYSKPLMNKIANSGSIQGMHEVPVRIQKLFVTAHDIKPEWHVKMQAAFQKYTDNAVSKTVNLPENASEEDVRQVFMLAYKEGCKGVTVYRYGSRDREVLGLRRREVAVETLTKKIHPRPRPKVTKGITEKIQTGCGNLYVTINEDEHGLCEVFAQMGKTGGCAAAQIEATSRLISLALRSGVDIKPILKQIKRIRCPSPFLSKEGVILSCPDAIAKAIERYLKEEKGKDISKTEILKNRQTQESPEKHIAIKGYAGICPDCGEIVDYVEGCVVCKVCGYTKCG